MGNAVSLEHLDSMNVEVGWECKTATSIVALPPRSFLSFVNGKRLREQLFRRRYNKVRHISRRSADSLESLDSMNGRALLEARQQSLELSFLLPGAPLH